MANDTYKNNSNTSKKIAIWLGVVIGIIFIILYCYKWYEVKELEKYLNSYLISTNTISQQMNDIKEIKAVLSETPSYYFVYISYTQDKDIFNFEKKLKPLIDEYNLQNSFYYLNITDIKKNNDNYQNDIAKELNIEAEKINKVPVILYFKDNKLVKKVTTVKNFEALLKEEDIKAR